MKKDIPTKEQCEALLISHNVQEEIIIHSKIVCDVARRIGRDLKWLRDRGPNIALITAAAMLHDIAKGQPDHAAAGGKLLREQGYNLIAGIVESYNNIEFSGKTPVTEKEIVFIADKLVKGDQMVTVVYIYDNKIRSCTDKHQIAELEKCKATALRIKTSIEKETEKNLEELAIAES
ncbi:HD domain-containing protein [Maridesulfovibrio zosterae]|uniref:HD domain-containing protein n=1 Tax=Maridesulfovibrio zosterae TaxID=82171 RepID=UPI0003F9802C|nr:HD domain-containing protein [Maridesulfovibrio zosterae]